MAKNSAEDLVRWRNPPLFRMLSPGTLLSGNHTNKVWRGMCQVPQNMEPAIPMIIKWIEKKELLAAELACSLAARAFKLDIPIGVLVLAEKDQLNGLPRRVTGHENDFLLCFGSEFQWPDDTIARPSDSDSAKEWVWNRICQTSQGSNGGVWDELIANEDRHSENVIFDGIRWWLIDHERAMTPLNKFMLKFAELAIRQTVIDHKAKTNPLMMEMVHRRPNDHKMEKLPNNLMQHRIRLRWIADQTKNWTTGISQVDTVLMMTEIYLRSIDIRLPALALHVRERISGPYRPPLWSQDLTL